MKPKRDGFRQKAECSVIPPILYAATPVGAVSRAITSSGIVQPANFNSPGQIVISGETDIVLAALEIAKERGARRAIQLVVSGAFHSDLMKDAQQGLKEVLDNTTFKDSSMPVYTNVTSKPETKAEKLRDLLLEQLTSPVRWEEIIVNMINDGNNDFVEVKN